MNSQATSCSILQPALPRNSPIHIGYIAPLAPHLYKVIVAVDYDPGASEVNQLNRIKLMLSAAKENLK